MQNVGQPFIPDTLFRQEEHLLNDVGAERAMLACVMKAPSLIIEATRNVPPEAISFSINRYIYEIMRFIYLEANRYGWPIHFDAMSMLAVAKYLGPQMEAAFLAKTEGMEQIRSVEMLTPMVEASQYGQYAHVVLDRFNRRRLYVMSREVQKQVLDFQQFPSAQAIAIAQESRYADIAFDTGAGKGKGGISHLGDEGPEFMAKCRLAYHYKHRNLFNVPCSLFPYLMQLMNGGFRRKGLIMVCARPKVGKSSLLLSTGINTAVDLNTPTLYLDTEMSGEEQLSRALSHIAKVNEFHILQGKFCADGLERSAVNDALQRLTNSRFHYVNIAGRPIEYVQSVMRQFRNQFVGSEQYQDPETGKVYTFSNPGLVIYDWLKLPDAGSLNAASEHQLLGFQASAIKDAAAELDLPVIAGAQNNRSAIGVTGEEWENNAEAYIAGSDRIAQFCSALCILRNVTPEEGSHIAQRFGVRQGKAGANSLMYNQVLHLILQRQGPDFRRGIPLYLDRGYARYEEMATPEVLEWMDKNLGKKAASMENKPKKGDLLPANQPASTNAVLTPLQPDMGVSL